MTVKFKGKDNLQAVHSKENKCCSIKIYKLPD